MMLVGVKSFHTRRRVAERQPYTRNQGVKSDGMMLVGDQQKPSKLQGLLCAGDGSVAPGTKVECEGATTQVAENMDLKLFQKLELKVLDELKVFYKKTMKLSAGGQQLVAERVKPNSNVR
ncbi:hypothetical protein T484DRAFT_1740740 [Baffinella frigidus]|nr:hypothetical protein T484DRAFT_1740740 [Cryptophyta sp. CCMP2293]